MASAVQWLLFVDSAAIRSWAAFQVSSDSCPAGRSSTASGVRPEGGQLLGLAEERRHGGGFVHRVAQQQQLLATAPYWLADGSGSADQKDRREESPDAEASKAGQEGDRAGRAGVVRAVSGSIGVGGVEQDQPGDLLGIAVGVDHRVVAADGVPDEHVRAVLAGAVEQGVQFGGGGHPVL